MLAVKVSADGIAAIDGHASAAHVTRSEWTRAALSLALARPELVAARLSRATKECTA